MQVPAQTLEKDLALLFSLPEGTLSRLIDPSRAAPKPLGNATSLLAETQSSPSPETSVALSRAYVGEMRERTGQLEREEVSQSTAASDLQRLEKLRDTAETVLAAVDEYAATVKTSG